MQHFAARRCAAGSSHAAGLDLLQDSAAAQGSVCCRTVLLQESAAGSFSAALWSLPLTTLMLQPVLVCLVPS